MKKTTTPFMGAIIALLAFIAAPITAKSATPPPAQFNTSANSGCAPLTVQFFNASYGNGAYQWNFGDTSSGNLDTSSLCSPVHTFVNPGTYTVTLTFVTMAGTFTATQTITVHPKPNPIISGPDTLCQLTNQTYSVANNPGSSYYWQVTGGTISGSAFQNSVSINWTTAGTATLSCTETNIFGCSKTTTITILVAPQPVLGNFCGKRGSNGKPDGGHQGEKDTLSENSCYCENSIQTFNALAPNGMPLPNGVFSYNWIITGGSIVSGQNTNQVQVLVGNDTQLVVELVVSSPFGCTDTGICVFPICPAPYASLTADTACLGGATQFNASASIPQNAITYYEVQFGDNTTANFASPFFSHTYAATGSYQVKLIVHGANDCIDDTTITVIVNPGEAPPIECIGTVCHNTNHCYSTPYFPGATYTWTVTGGTGTPNNNGDSVCVNWGNGPQGTIHLNVVGGPYSCGSNTVNIPIFPDTFLILGPDTICANTPTIFTTALVPGSCLSWTVNGNPDTAVNNSGNAISVTFPNAGTATIEVFGENDLVCCKSKGKKTIVIQPGIVITGTGNTVCPNSSATYSSNFPVNWSVNGGTITFQNPTNVTVLWGNGGTGSVVATALNPSQVCEDVVSLTVTILPPPPNPPINGQTIVCKGAVETYNYINAPGIAASFWSVNPNVNVTLTPSGSSATLAFLDTGTFVLTATYQSAQGCFSSSNISILVVDTALPVITGTDSVCQGATSTYTIPANPSGIYAWSVIGGSITAGGGNNNFVTVLWGNISQGQVNVINTLCGGISQVIVTVNGIPVGDIVQGPPNCFGNAITLTGPAGYSYSWSPSGSTNQTITANTPGTYTLTITKNGCSTTLTEFLASIPTLPKPNVNIVGWGMASPFCPTPVQLQATYNANWTYSWSPGGGTTNLQFVNVDSTYHTVIVTNEHGCKDTATVLVRLDCDTVISNGSGTGCNPNASVNPSYDQCTGQFQLNGTNVSIAFWNFNDGNYSNLFNPIHFFTSLGSKTVTIWVLSTGGCWQQFTYTTPVNSLLRPKINHQFPQNCNYSLVQFSLHPSSTILSNGSVNYQWTFGDGSPTGSGTPINHNYNTPGCYQVSLTTSDNWCSVTTLDTVCIQPFQAAFSTCSGCTGQPIQFVDQSTSGLQIVGWDWDFGDGWQSNMQSPFHVFANYGSYNVQLIITDFAGCMDTFTSSVFVDTFNAGTLTFNHNGNPVTGNTHNICQGDLFVATAPNQPGWSHSWNNGITTVSDTISQTGSYWVIVNNGLGCTDTLGPFLVIVRPRPVATILAADSSCGFANLFALTGLGYTYQWYVNPGALSYNTPNISIYSSGTFTVGLHVTNNWGCKDSDSTSLVISPNPILWITGPPTNPCQGDSAVLLGNSIPPNLNWVWNNNSTADSITVFYSGTYSITATSPEGCVGTASYYQGFNPLPDLSIIPSGCYTVCKNQLPIHICGPIPQNGQIFTYNWYHNGNLVANTQDIFISMPGDYWLEVTDQFSCGSVSDTFTINIIPGPVANIGSQSPNPVICQQTGNNIPLFAIGAQNDVVYTWYLNGNQVATGPNYNALQPGVYVLHAFRSECCEAWDTLKIKEEDCCWDSSVDFTLIQDSTVISTNTVWDGKYYVAGKVFVTNKAVFDLTEVDVVFSRTGEIIFLDSTIIRANNSVFRPCDMNDVWVGFTFKDSSQGLIHTSLYKNAEVAINIMTDKDYSVRITDNTFSNCNIGVQIDKAYNRYKEGITRNSFVIENHNFSAPQYYGTFDYFGIRLRRVYMEELVSQNEMRNSDKTSQPNRFYGIFVTRSSVFITENKFSNMYRAIDMSMPTELSSIENNEIEQTMPGKFASDVQIRVTNSYAPVTVYANELRNSANSNQNNVAIYAADAWNLNIRDNNVKGFRFGIEGWRLDNCTINENDIDLAGNLGITIHDSKKSRVNCNIVRLKDFRGGGGWNSIGINTQNCDSSLWVYANCIFDTRFSIFTWNNVGVGNTIPKIRNNYLYNYQSVGIVSISQLGAVGAIGDPGRNTMVCNNHGAGGLDFWVFPAASVAQRCNFGVTHVAGTAITVCPPNTMYSSTAACGQHIIDPKFYTLNQWDICDIFTEKSFPIDLDKGSPNPVTPAALQALDLNDLSDGHIRSVAMYLAAPDKNQLFEIWINKMSVSVRFSSFELQRWKAEQWVRKGDFVHAVQMLELTSPQNSAEENWKKLLIAEWSLQNQNFTNQRSTIMQLANQTDEASHAAKDLLQAYEGNHDYRFQTPAAPALPEMEQILVNDEQKIKISPNPANGKVKIEFNLPVNHAVTFRLTDALGRTIHIEPTEMTGGTITLDVSALSSGVYMIKITDPASGQSLESKLVVTD